MSNDEIVFAKYHVEDEGNSVAGWTGMALIVLGFTIGAVGLFIDVMPVVWTGVALIPVGVLAWIIMQFAGLGPKEEH